MMKIPKSKIFLVWALAVAFFTLADLLNMLDRVWVLDTILGISAASWAFFEYKYTKAQELLDEVDNDG